MTLDDLLQPLSPSERERLLDFCDFLVFSLDDFSLGRRRYLDIVLDEAASISLKVAAGLLNGLARRSSDSTAASLDTEAALALGHCRSQIAALADYDAALAGSDVSPSAGPLSAISDFEFVLRLHEVVLGRCARPDEITNACDLLRRGSADRAGLIHAAFAEALRVERREASLLQMSGESFHIMGTGQLVTAAAWRARVEEVAGRPDSASLPPPRVGGLAIQSRKRPLISVITSLYKGGEYIERFMDNMLAQTCFGDAVELIIVDANSPDGEYSVIERHARNHPNIRLLRLPERIGIYAAWNLAIGEARVDFITNANVDDMRRADSLELQAGVLDDLPSVDVVYQDFYYTMDPNLDYSDVASLGFKSELPIVTAAVFMHCNPPHHAPMWRRRLHDELGLFDVSYQSAGDYEFWLRSVAAGKRFFKLEEPHAVYYQNPRGVSTRPGTLGHAESRRALKRHGRQLLRMMERSGQAGGVVAPATNEARQGPDHPPAARD